MLAIRDIQTEFANSAPAMSLRSGQPTMNTALPTAQNWFASRTVAPGLTLFWEPHIHPWYRANIWHLRGREMDLLIDTGMGIGSLKAALGPLADRPILAIATHGHIDHMGGHHEFDHRAIHELESSALETLADDRTLASGFLAYPDAVTARPHPGWTLSAFTLKAAPATRVLKDGDRVDLGGSTLTVIHLPGHSPGSIGLLDEKTGTLFSGDAIYDGELLDDLPHSDVQDYAETMERLRKLDLATIHGGHRDSFDQQRMVILIDQYLAGRRIQGCPGHRD
jgi:glyoxylase-like metal-dependent hydrolase (beta-lactamase superfamily II)